MSVEHQPDHEDGWTVLYQERPIATLVFTGRGIEDGRLLFSLTADSQERQLAYLCQGNLIRDATFQNNRTRETVPGAHFPLTLIDGLVALRDQRSTQSALSRAATEISEFFNVGTLVISVALTLAIMVLTFSDWLFGRTVQYEFFRVASSHLSRSEFEEEFTRRVTAAGYQVFNLRVTSGYDGRFDAWITLQNVPAGIDDRQVEADLRHVMRSFSNRPVEVERR